MSQVFHIKSESYPAWLLGQSVQFPEDYELVAKLDTDDLGRIFELTNSIDAPWYENEGVEVVKQSRSTSVGDIVQLSSGVFCMCLPIGWKTYHHAPPQVIPADVII